MKIEFSLQGFSKNIQISDFIKILPVGAELFQADRRTDGWTKGQTWTKLIVAFRNFAKVLKSRLL